MRNVSMVLILVPLLCDGRRLHARQADSLYSYPGGDRCQKALANLMLAHTSATSWVPRATRASPGAGFRRMLSTQDASRAGVSRMLVDQSAAAAVWMSQVRVPAAFVAGAALQQGYALEKDMRPERGDNLSVSVMKTACRLLFLTAFGLGIACVFVATVTGTMLLAKGLPDPFGISPLQVLHREAEFEYLLVRVSFFQGLLNWLSAVALHRLLPRRDEKSKASRLLRLSEASALASISTYMMAFYNTKISYYGNYGKMLVRLVTLTISRWYLQGFRVLPILALIPVVSTVVNSVRSINCARDSGEEWTDGDIDEK